MGAAAAPQAGAVASAGHLTAPAGRTISNKPPRLGISPLPARMVVDVRETPMISLVALRAASARLAAIQGRVTGCAAPVGVISSMPSKNAGPGPDTALMIPRVIGSRLSGMKHHESLGTRAALYGALSKI